MVISTNSRAKGGQHYQNTVKFHHNRSSKKTKRINELPVNGLCNRCSEKIVWRKAYRKYKPLTTPKRCTFCSEKAIKDAYHVICRPCANAKRICEKCLEPHVQHQDQGQSQTEALESTENASETTEALDESECDESDEEDYSD